MTATLSAKALSWLDFAGYAFYNEDVPYSTEQYEVTEDVMLFGEAQQKVGGSGGFITMRVNGVEYKGIYAVTDARPLRVAIQMTNANGVKLPPYHLTIKSYDPTTRRLITIEDGGATIRWQRSLNKVK